MAKRPIMVMVDEAFDDEIDAYAALRGLSKGALLRLATAKEIGYDVSLVNVRSERRRKYATAEEREAAAKARQKDKRDSEREALLAIQRGNQAEAISIMEAYLARRKAEDAPIVVDDDVDDADTIEDENDTTPETDANVE